MTGKVKLFKVLLMRFSANLPLQQALKPGKINKQRIKI